MARWGIVSAMETADRRRWPRIILTLPPDTHEALGDLAIEHYRDRKREALRLLVDAIARERRTPTVRERP
jgi:hypothetical protein